MEEIDSDDDTDTQGVGLISGQKRFASDPLQFTGMDLAPGSKARRDYNDDTEDSEDVSEDSEVEGTNALQMAFRDKEEALVQSALARIRRAQEKGKSEVKLNQDELNALEKRRKRMQSAATSKARKGSGSDRGSESERRRNEQVRVSVPLAAIGEPVRKQGRPRRSEASDQPPPSTANGPGFLVAGPDGLQYAPVSYYPPQVTAKRNPETRPRSATSAQLRGTPPPHFPYPAPGNARHLAENTRPASSSSHSPRRPLPDEASWQPAYSRRSSISSQHSHGVDPFEYQEYSEGPSSQSYLQQQPGRRYFSGPPEVSYSTRRNPPAMSSASYAPSTGSSNSRRRSRRGEQASVDSSSEEEDHSDDLGNGVQVFVEEEPAPEPVKERPPVVRKPVSSGSNRQRRGKR